MAEKEKQPKPKSAAEWLAENRDAVSAAFDTLKAGDAFPPIIEEAREKTPRPMRDTLALKAFANADHRHLAAPHVDLRTLHLNAGYWSAFCGKGLQPFDEIMVIASDQNSVATFLITDADDVFVNAQMIAYHRIQRTPRIGAGRDWLDLGDALVQRAATAQMRGGWIIRRKDGVEIDDNGIPFRDVEAARRYYNDCAWRHTNKEVFYYPR